MKRVFWVKKIVSAYDCFLKARDLGSDVGSYFIALYFQFGLGVEQDIEKAIEYFKEAIDRGNESAIIDLGVLFVNGEFIEPDYEKAYNLFKPLADRGIADAQYNMGSMFERSSSKKFRGAFDYYNKAHIQGFQ